MQRIIKRLKCYKQHEKHLTSLKESTRYSIVIKKYMIFLSNPQVWTLSGTWSDRALSASGLTNMELMMTLDTILLPVICVVGIFALSTKKRKRV